MLPHFHARRCSTSPTRSPPASVVPPRDVVRHDERRPLPRRRADKGTATFSDIANAISQEYGFWLGDAFASGGSAGYDHKAMGITARGAWESVRRHFRELGTRRRDHRLHRRSGIGDMSGDVFGNGMLLSRHIKLVGAFDHRHVFLDPDPDPAAELRRARAPLRAAGLVLGRLRRVVDLARAAASSPAPPSRSRSRPRCGRRSVPMPSALDPGRADPGASAARRSTCSGTAASAPT